MTDKPIQPGDLIFVGNVDLSGVFRGKAVVGAEWENRILWGVGYPPANIMITPFGELPPNPWGSRGDVFLVPDTAAMFALSTGDGLPVERFALAQFRKADGTPWECCPRGFAAEALADLERETGLTLRGAFEHEFTFLDRPTRSGDAFALDAFRRLLPFAHALVAALLGAGLRPESVIPEFASAQVEVPIGPARGLAIADEAVVLREIVRAIAPRFGGRASFTPIIRPGGVGNGVHLHLSLLDRDGRPVTYDARSPTGLSRRAGAFFAGVRSRLPDIIAMTAASVISYERLKPNRWSAAYNTLASRDREAALRICPVRPGTGTPIEAQFNVELRATDATANPYLVIGLVARAGLEGLQAELEPDEPFEGDPTAMSPEDLASRGIERLATSLEIALDRLEARGAHLVPPELLAAFVGLKRAEAASFAHASPEEIALAYREAF